MRPALSILKHAFGMIFSNFAGTVRTLAPGLVIILAAALTLYVFAPSAFQTVLVDRADPGQITTGNALPFVVSLIAMIFGFVVMAVIWHRYVLLSEDDRAGGLMPPMSTVWGYVGTTILLSLIAILVALPLFIVLGIIATATGGSPAVLGILTIAVTAILGWVIMRYSLPLPAIAIGNKIGFTDSWRATAPMSQTIFWLTVSLSIFNSIVSNIAAAPVGLPLVFSSLLQLLVSIVTTLISASVLTTLYGILIEGREIDG